MRRVDFSARLAKPLPRPAQSLAFVPAKAAMGHKVQRIAGTAAEVAAWMPGAMAVFTFCLHTTTTHEVRFTGPDSATGRVHVFNRNGVEWEGRSEIFDVSAIYEDTYERVGDGWRISSRTERTLCMTGGAFADMIRGLASGS